ncbi:unnamed protein product [Musa hybrid cultivar]
MAFHHKPVDVKVIFIFVYPSLYLIEYHPHVLDLFLGFYASFLILRSLGGHFLVEQNVAFSFCSRIYNPLIAILPIINVLVFLLSFSFQIWVDLYATRRYGRSVPTLQDAWQILYNTLYNCTDGAYVSLIFVFSIVG